MYQIALTVYGSPKYDVGAGSAYLPCFQDILIRELLYGYALWDEIPQQAIVAFESFAKGKPLAMQSLNHATFFQRKMAAGYMYVLHCVRMEVIHSDCSFVDDFSQNHFNMKLHYGFFLINCSNSFYN